jgi:hypothetical protein
MSMRYFIGFLLIILLPACATQRRSPTSFGRQIGQLEAIEHFSSRRSGAKFVSRDGRWYGMDSDAHIILKSKGRVEVTEFGYGVDSYDGTYSVDRTGAIQVGLRNYRASWPSMFLYKDRRGFILVPTDRDQSFRMGSRAGAVSGSGMAPYWPFRQTN